MPTSLKVENLSIDDLDLDVENPRIRKFIEQYGAIPNFDQMLLALGAGSSDPESGSTVTFQSLKESIRAQGGVINPIFVERKPDGRYRVVEGKIPGGRKLSHYPHCYPHCAVIPPLLRYLAANPANSNIRGMCS